MRKGTWRCSDCTNNPSSSNSDPQLATQLDEMKATLKTITRQLEPLATLVEDMKSVKADISHLKDSIEGLDSKVKALELQVAEYKKMQEEVSGMHRDMHEKEQWARANNVEIKGVPVKKSENLYDLVSRISQVIKCPVRQEDINYIARVPNLNEKSDKNIITALNNRYTKENFVAATRGLRSLSLKDIYIRETGGFS